MDQQPPIPQKLKLFNQELQALCDKYLYKLRAVIKYTDAGLYAEIQASDIIPPVVPQTTQEAPSPSPISTPEAPKTDTEKATA